ncbi:hypothetical protein [Acidithiobacillus thiooxidans]|uniref:Uncharacterized protein n=1 Tax=Acidithiobacillus thiooxidans ATCC 19377 TaxID=637390 RepID=A0A5P9XMI4_ACITH|nr:hypothetical protein [Acidithiobacillus thiooxidans]QFX95205.1 hypothetical protein GCD22_00739 [Acidithiobacillus thiooxidans ATCC 19377]
MTKFSHFAADLGTTAEDLQEQLAQEAKRKGFTPPRPLAAVPRGYADAWARLFARSPAEIEAERQARTPAPPPQPPGSRRKS